MLIWQNIPGLLDLAIQGMLDDIHTREKVAHPSYKDKEQLDFQIILTKNYYVNHPHFFPH